MPPKKKQKFDLPSNSYEDDGNKYLVYSHDLITDRKVIAYSGKPVALGRAKELAEKLLNRGSYEKI